MYDELQEALDLRQELRELIRSPGWHKYVEILQSQAEMRQQADQALDLVNSENALAELIQLRAERRALDLARILPETLIEELTEDIESATSRSEPTDS